MQDSDDTFGHFYGDSYVESICIHCLAVVGRAATRAGLKLAEEQHVCKPAADIRAGESR